MLLLGQSFLFFFYWNFTTFLHKLSVGFAPLLTWSGVTLLSRLLHFYTNRLLALFFYWLYWLCSAIGSVWTCYIVVSFNMLLHKLSISFTPLLAWCGLSTSLFCGLTCLCVVFVYLCLVICQIHLLTYLRILFVYFSLVFFSLSIFLWIGDSSIWSALGAL